MAELGGGTSDAPFSYRIVGLRKDVVAPRLNRLAIAVPATQAVPVPGSAGGESPSTS